MDMNLIEQVLGAPYYSDGACVIYCGDARGYVPRLPDGMVDLVLTDPPYGHNNNNNGDLIARIDVALGRGTYEPGRDDRPIAGDGEEEANALVRWLFRESARLLKEGTLCCCCGGGGPDPQFARWSLWMDEVLKFKMCVIWDKGPLGLGWHYRRDWECVLVGTRGAVAGRWYGGNSTSNVIRDIPRIIPRNWQHPTEKPVELMRRFISWHTEPGDLVLDPFMGGGATLRAAKDLGRSAIGIELEERWCELAAKRLGQEVFDFEGA